MTLRVDNTLDLRTGVVRLVTHQSRTGHPGPLLPLVLAGLRHHLLPAGAPARLMCQHKLIRAHLVRALCRKQRSTCQVESATMQARAPQIAPLQVWLRKQRSICLASTALGTQDMALLGRGRGPQTGLISQWYATAT